MSHLGHLLEASNGQPVPADLQAGEVVGDCRIIRFVAEGGMGRVYEARQMRPDRSVAVKVIRPQRLTPAAIRRFTYEAEVLGRLQHAAIAQIFSAGIKRVQAGDAPYLVMEFVPDGLAITSFSRRHNLSITERVRLFLAGCEGIAYAHRIGVLHRDLKPKNIIVAGTGRVKVIDFGVARFTSNENGLPANETATGELVGTLQAMSPEQVSTAASEVGTPSDVYALGLILYEMLAGHPAYDCHKGSLAAAIKLIEEFDPPILSSVVPGVSRDLSMIVATCLRKDSRERYQSAGDLAADLQRYLQGEPIRAREPTLLDSVRYWWKRYRLVMIGAAAFLVMLLGSVVAISVFAVRAERSRVAAIEERNRVSGMLDFFLDVFRASSPELQGPGTQLRDVLEPAVKSAETSFAADPLSRARVQVTLGRSLRGLSALEAAGVAVEAAERAAAELDGSGEEQREMIVSVLLETAELALVRGDHSRAAANVAEAVKLAYAIDPQGPLYADSLALFAGVCRQTGELEDAEKALRQSLAIMEEAGNDGDDYSDRLVVLADILFSTRARFQEAEAVLERLIGLEEKRHGTEHPRVARALQQLARLYQVRVSTAAYVEPLLRHAAELIADAYGPDHPATASAYAKLARELLDDEHLTESRQLIERALDIYQRHFGDQHDKTAACLELLARWHVAADDLAAALPLQERAVRIFRQSGGVNRGAVQNSLLTLARYRSAVSDRAGAVAAYREVWPVLEPALSPDPRSAVDNIQAIILLGDWVEVLLEQDQFGEAEKRARQCLAIAEDNFDDSHPIWRFRGRVPIVNVLLSTNRIEEARPIVAACREVFQMVNPDHPEWKRIRELERRFGTAEAGVNQADE